MKTESCDYIVVGSGIAGLRGALALAREGSVKVFCKGDPWQSNTRYAQGGIAAAMQEGDAVEFHLQDTIQAGDGLCYEPAVRALVEEGPVRIMELVKWGAKFDQQGGRFVFGREGAHSRNRILHAGDATGKEIVRALLNWAERTRGIQVSSDHPACDLLIQDGRCAGIYALDEKTGERITAHARAVLLTTGGAGQIFSHTTNPSVATGDGVAMAHRAGAEIMDAEFYQFHPTAFHRQGAPRFLITEALRGEGAVLRNVNGKAFMENYHPMLELAPRDIVSRAILSEMRKTNSSFVYLDATSIGKGKLKERFPTIAEFLHNYHIDLTRDWIPVSPSAHYWMGGVRTDLLGETSLPGLYAAGEVACNGVHGANRLASNSLLEGLVFGARAAEAMLNTKEHRKDMFPVSSQPRAFALKNVEELRNELQKSNWENLGILREETGIRTALSFVQQIPSFEPASLPELELLNLADCSKLMSAFALHRQESRGSHYRLDFPDLNRQFNGRHTILRNGEIVFTDLLDE
jgi:L-aspartate oxidase